MARFPCVALLLLLLAGCASVSTDDKPSELERPLGRSHLLFGAPTPYRALQVEIDAVEGCAPSAEDVAALQAFLNRYCAKPDGVRVVVDDIIPRAKARGRTVASLELEHLDGPPDDGTAFLYFFFYRSGRGGVRDATTNPYFSAMPFPAAAFIDRSYGRFFRLLGGRSMDRLMLLHEAGHALGLVDNARQRGGHCTNKPCLMNAAVAWQGRKFLKGRDPWEGYRDLCAQCAADLAENTRSRAPEHQRFVGRYFVRHEAGYHVLAMPDFIYVHVGEFETLDRSRLEELRAAAIAANEQSLDVKTSAIGASEAPAAITALLRDAADPVRAVGGALLENAFGIGDEWRAALSEALADLPDGEARRRVLAEMMAPAEPLELATCAEPAAFLSDARWTSADVGWGVPARNRYYVHHRDAATRDWRELLFLTLGGEHFGKGLYAHAPSRYAFPLGGGWRTFTAKIGLRDGAEPGGSAVFVVRADGQERYRSPVLRVGETAEVALEIEGVQQLELVTENGTPGNNSYAWAIWAAPRLSRAPVGAVVAAHDAVGANEVR